MIQLSIISNTSTFVCVCVCVCVCVLEVSISRGKKLAALEIPFPTFQLHTPFQQLPSSLQAWELLLIEPI